MTPRSLVKRLLPASVWQTLRMLAARKRAAAFLLSAEHARKAVGNFDPAWRSRIDDVLASPDNLAIVRCPDAGTLEGYAITMHNGVRVCANGYYGNGNLNLLIENRGVHEPQEEKAFEEIIQLLPEKCTMLELGSYWAFYSLSLLAQRPNARCFMVEPDPANLLSGQLNFAMNRRRGHFTLAAVGDTPSKDPRVITVDAFCRTHGIRHLDILHSDIQGYELAMLDGAKELLSAGRADYVFISTHSNDLHDRCRARLSSLGYTVMVDANLDQSYSVDGILVAKHRSIDKPRGIDISLKRGQAVARQSGG